MKQMIGFSRTLKANWLDFTVDLVSNISDEQEVKDKLNEYLRFEISDPTNMKKVRSILINIWFYDNKKHPIKDRAIELVKKYTDSKFFINWCMMLSSYPVFADLAQLIGKLVEFQDEITLKQITQKIFDTWGETSTLFYSVQKLVSTLVNIGALEKVKTGTYRIPSINIAKTDLLKFLVEILLMIDESSYHNFNDLGNSKFFYPFRYALCLDDFAEDENFTLSRFGDEMTISLK